MITLVRCFQSASIHSGTSFRCHFEVVPRHLEPEELSKSDLGFAECTSNVPVKHAAGLHASHAVHLSHGAHDPILSFLEGSTCDHAT